MIKPIFSHLPMEIAFILRIVSISLGFFFLSPSIYIYIRETISFVYHWHLHRGFLFLSHNYCVFVCIFENCLCISVCIESVCVCVYIILKCRCRFVSRLALSSSATTPNFSIKISAIWHVVRHSSHFFSLFFSTYYLSISSLIIIIIINFFFFFFSEFSICFFFLTHSN